MVETNLSMLGSLGAILGLLLVVKLRMDHLIKKQQKGQAAKRVRLTTTAWIVGDSDEESHTKA